MVMPWQTWGGEFCDIFVQAGGVMLLCGLVIVVLSGRF